MNVHKQQARANFNGRFWVTEYWTPAGWRIRSLWDTEQEAQESADAYIRATKNRFWLQPGEKSVVHEYRIVNGGQTFGSLCGGPRAYADECIQICWPDATSIDWVATRVSVGVEYPANH